MSNDVGIRCGAGVIVAVMPGVADTYVMQRRFC
jgi:hypothetical protein